MRRAALALVLLALLAAGCADDQTPVAARSRRTTTTPALARAAKAPGEILVRGDASPASHGPYELSGTYVARFQQYAPEDPRMDFGGQTPFVARLDPHADSDAGEHHSVKLFEQASRTGTVTIRARGRLYLDVEFGDFPYVIRLTPKR